MTNTLKERFDRVVTKSIGGTHEHSKTLANDLQFDSLDGVELVMALEEEFDITIDDDWGKAMTLGDLFAIVKGLVKE